MQKDSASALCTWIALSRLPTGLNTYSEVFASSYFISFQMFAAGNSNVKQPVQAAEHTTVTDAVWNSQHSFLQK